jgi:tyrosine-specific transport protein
MIIRKFQPKLVIVEPRPFSALKLQSSSSSSTRSYPPLSPTSRVPFLFIFHSFCRIFQGLYLYNLISGLLLADVAITLHESSECDVPSSFKDFVDAALSSEVAGTLTSFLSLLSNGCFLAYGTIAAGRMLIDVLRPPFDVVAGGYVDPAIIGTCAFASAISLFAITQTNAGLERLANCVVFVVFASFAYLLVPSVGNVSDPLGTFLTPGTDVGGEGGYGDALASAVPLLLSSLMYQNIVPSVTKLLDFDRAKSTIAISIGSFIPMLMYVAWCYASLGGGLDVSTSSSAGSVALAAFSMSALFVSCLTAVMSLAEECEAIFSRRTTTASTVDDEGDCIAPSSRFSIPAVAASVIPPVGAALAFAGGGDVTSALHFNGAFIVPILYGILPTILYGGVRQLRVRDAALQSMNGLPQLLLGAGTICAIGQEIVQEVSCLQN